MKVLFTIVMKKKAKPKLLNIIIQGEYFLPFIFLDPKNKNKSKKLLQKVVRFSNIYKPINNAGIAQLVEQLNRNQEVGGSSPLGGSILYRAPKVMRYVAAGLYPAIRGSTPRGCTNLKRHKQQTTRIVQMVRTLPLRWNSGVRISFPVDACLVYGSVAERIMALV